MTDLQYKSMQKVWSQSKIEFQKIFTEIETIVEGYRGTLSGIAFKQTTSDGKVVMWIEYKKSDAKNQSYVQELLSRVNLVLGKYKAKFSSVWEDLDKVFRQKLDYIVFSNIGIECYSIGHDIPVVYREIEPHELEFPETYDKLRTRVMQRFALDYQGAIRILREYAPVSDKQGNVEGQRFAKIKILCKDNFETLITHLEKVKEELKQKQQRRMNQVEKE